jgi:hypothetical protein
MIGRVLLRFAPVVAATLAVAFVQPDMVIRGAGGATVMIMQHDCVSPMIQTESEILAIEQRERGNVAAMMRRVIACPTVSRPGDRPTNGLTGDPGWFDYRITDADGRTKTLAAARYERAMLCELDVAFDIDGDSRWTDGVCLDVSHYVVGGLAMGQVTIEQIRPPSRTRFGVVRFTPTELDHNNDRQSLKRVTGRTIKLDIGLDADASVMLHVYNFRLNPDASSLADSSTEAPTPDRSHVPMALLLLACVLGGFGIVVAAVRVRSQ